MQAIEEQIHIDQDLLEHDDTSIAIDLEVYDNFEDLLQMQSEWDCFMEAMNVEIFLTYDWCRLWWKYYGKGRKLSIYIFKHENNIVGIFPLFFEIIGLWPFYLNVIKVVGTDFLPITVNLPLKKEYLYESIRLLLNRLNTIYNWDIIHIGAISGKCEIIDLLEKVFVDILSSSHTIIKKYSDVQTYFKVADNLENHIASFSKVQRKRLRHFYNDNTPSESIDSQFAEEEQFDSFFHAFVKIHQAKWQEIGQAGHFEDWPDSLRFHHEVASKQLKHDRLRLLKLLINGEEAGYQYSYKFGDTYYLFLNARVDKPQFKHINYYNLLICEDVRHAIEENVKYLDSMRGKYENKLQAGGYLLPVRNLYIYSNQWIKLLRIYPMLCFFSLLNIIYLKIFRRRLLPKFGIKPGPFIKLWIKTHTLAFLK